MSVSSQALLDLFGFGAELTCGDNDGLANKKHLKSVAILLAPVSIRPEYLFFADGPQVAQRKTWSWARNVPILPPGLPVAAVANHLEAGRAVAKHMTTMPTGCFGCALHIGVVLKLVSKMSTCLQTNNRTSFHRSPIRQAGLSTMVFP